MPQRIFTCVHCGTIKVNFLHYIKHLKSMHESKPRFSVSCHFDGCRSIYTKVDSFAKHVRRTHPYYSVHSDCSSLGAVGDEFDPEQGTEEIAIVHDKNDASQAPAVGCQTTNDLVICASMLLILVQE